MTMIELVARHMHAKLHLMVGGYRDFDSLSSGDPDLDRYDCKEWWIEHARAAIEAMREMTPEMLESMKLNTWAYIEGKWDDDMHAEVEDHEIGWRAAIDAALKEGEK